VRAGDSLRKLYYAEKVRVRPDLIHQPLPNLGILLFSSFRKKYFMLDPDFPARLFKSGSQRTLEFIQYLYEDYSKRGLTEKTDKCVAISGLENRVARATKCQTRYGVFQPYLHRNLLWQRSGEEIMQRIRYETQVVPSWSWMAYDGGIQFMEIPFGEVDWMVTLQFKKKYKYGWFNKKGKAALLTDIGVFQNCGLERKDTSYTILNLSRVERGWIRYDVEASEGLDAERCVVVGRETHENRLGLRKYYILVVRPTNVDNEYRRVGIGWIYSDYVRRQDLNVRVV
jgi:hypothetical protein